MNVARASRLAWCEQELEGIRALASALEERYQAQLEQLHPEQARSGLNLLHYMALRRRDIHEFQDELAAFGLSSLGRSEAHVLATIHAVHHAVRALQGLGGKQRRGPVTFKQGAKILKRHTRLFLGRKLKGSAARIMVTLPAEAADDPKLVRDLLEAGMNCARINCAQGDPAQWDRILANIARARRITGRGCRTFMDLAGPKIRTGPLCPGPRILAVRTCGGRWWPPSGWCWSQTGTQREGPWCLWRKGSSGSSAPETGWISWIHVVGPVAWTWCPPTGAGYRPIAPSPPTWRAA